MPPEASHTRKKAPSRPTTQTGVPAGIVPSFCESADAQAYIAAASTARASMGCASVRYFSGINAFAPDRVTIAQSPWTAVISHGSPDGTLSACDESPG